MVDKPRGPTSHDVVMRLRRALGTREIGHAGTLDPMATGVLVLAVGEATKLVPWLAGQNKAYRATVALGIATDTLDAEGHETERAPLDVPLLRELDPATEWAACPKIGLALEQERVRTSQIPPAYSAIKKDGMRSYERARKGDSVELAPRDVRVRRIEVEGRSRDPARLELVLDVSKGYYVRSLARDLARALGTVGHLTALRRTHSGCFSLEDAAPLDAPRDALLTRLSTLPDVAARVFPVVRMTHAGAEDARHGRPVRLEDAPGATDEPSAWLDPAGRLVAIGAITPAGARVLRGFRPALGA